jgi:trans-aconitate 2-methyltransferase
MWNADQYLRFSDSRSRPFFDLVAQIPARGVTSIADMGCGPGHLTKSLAERWPSAHVVGVDSSPEMLAKAQPLAIPGRLDFVQGDIGTWSPPGPLDIIVSNAALQWVTGHEKLIPRLTGMLAAEGTLAAQIPDHIADTPMRQAIEETSADPRWASLLQGVGLGRHSTRPLPWYVSCLHRLGFMVNAWETTYIHVLAGQNPVLEWLKGTSLVPLLEKLHVEMNEAFLQTLGQRLEKAYPVEEGLTLFAFPRMFLVATRKQTQ